MGAPERPQIGEVMENIVVLLAGVGGLVIIGLLAFGEGGK